MLQAPKATRVDVLFGVYHNISTKKVEQSKKEGVSLHSVPISKILESWESTKCSKLYQWCKYSCFSLMYKCTSETQFWQRMHTKIKRVSNSVSGIPQIAHGSPKVSWIQNPREVAQYFLLNCIMLSYSNVFEFSW